MTTEELLDIIDLDLLKEQIEMRKREELLSLHQFKIWQGSEGYWYTYLHEDDKRQLVKKRDKKQLENLIIEHCKRVHQTSFSALFDKWMEQKLEYGDIQKQTYDRYKTDFEKFFIKTGFAKKDVTRVTEKELEEFIKKTIAKYNLSRKAYSGLRTILIGILKMAKKDGYTQISQRDFFGNYLELSKNSFKKRVIRDEDSVFTKEEIAMIKEELNKKHSLVDLGILLTFQTGLRVGELSALQYSDVTNNRLEVFKTEERFKDDDGNYVFRVRSSAKTDAGNRTVILNDEALDIISMIRKQNPFGEYMFMKDGERMKSRVFTLRLLRVCKKLGINARSMHKIRKTYATKLINGKVDEKIIMKQLGHTDINCTRNYYYYDDKSFEEAAEQIEKALSV